MNTPNKYHLIYDTVRKIPAGYVATYGDIAAFAGLPGHARQVGYALHALPTHTDVPWQRVVNAKGGISLGRAYPGGELAQRRLLEEEGVAFDANGWADLKHFRWQPDREYYFKEGCHVLELSNSTADEAVSIARARVEPGQTTRWHHLRGTTERYLILEGQGRVEVGDLSPQTVTMGDVVIIPPLCRQRITNTGDTDLMFLAICSPRFKPENYEELG